MDGYFRRYHVFPRSFFRSWVFKLSSKDYDKFDCVGFGIYLWKRNRRFLPAYSTDSMKTPNLWCTSLSFNSSVYLFHCSLKDCEIGHLLVSLAESLTKKSALYLTELKILEKDTDCSRLSDGEIAEFLLGVYGQSLLCSWKWYVTSFWVPILVI